MTRAERAVVIAKSLTGDEVAIEMLPNGKLACTVIATDWVFTSWLDNEQTRRLGKLVERSQIHLMPKDVQRQAKHPTGTKGRRRG